LPLCHLCKKRYAQLVAAHIIPRAFYNLSADGQPAKVVSSARGRHPKRVRVGLYDQHILCEKCDGWLGCLDQHAAETLLPDGTQLRLGGQPVCFQYSEADPVLVHRFVASVLWRASISRLEFFQKVKLGPYEQSVARMLLESDCSMGSNIETVLGEFDSRHVGLLDPHSIRMDGVRYWVLYANRFILYFKTDAPVSMYSNCLSE
jgi:hypothetical protein